MNEATLSEERITVDCRNVCENFIFANIREFVASQIQSSRLY